jgi:N-acetylneuraminic acid mutarotase
MGEWTRNVQKFTLGPRFSHASCAVDKTIYVFGGQRKGYLDDVWAWDCAVDEWIGYAPKGKPPIARVQHTAVFTGSEVLVFGGYVENIAEDNDLHALDVLNAEREFTWTQPEVRGAVPPKRYGHSATMVGTRMVLIAGQDSSAQLNDVWVLDCPSYTWTPIEPAGALFIPRALHSASHVPGHGVVVVGGFNRKTRNMKEVMALRLGEGGSATAEWVALKPSDPDGVFKPRSQHRAVVQSQHLIIFGGFDGTRTRCSGRAH